MTKDRPRHLTARKLLGVTLGLATVSFVGAACSSGNLVADTGPYVADAGQSPRDADPRDSSQTDAR